MESNLDLNPAAPRITMMKTLAKIDELAKALDAERQRRQALDGVLADLRKGS